MRKDYNLEKRKYVIGGIVLLMAVIFGIQLFSLQIADARYKESADNNAFLRKTIYPDRGLIYDRNGELVVFNQPTYDVMLIPRNVQEFDTTEFCRIIKIDRDQFDRYWMAMRKSPSYSSYTPQRLIAHLGAKEHGALQEVLYEFPGFFIQKRVIRSYAYNSGANILGNIREANQNDIQADPYYQPGDYTGDLGVEKSYEKYLRGEKGVEILIRDAYGRIQGNYDNGAHDVAPQSGRDLRLSIDIKLQQYAESLMMGKRGAVVAIEPATGEILCLVTAPNYDPTLLVGHDRGKNYRMLKEEVPGNPLFDRSIMGAYPPGSTFKPSQGLIFLEEGVIVPETAFPCSHGYISGRLKVGCHGHGSPLALKPALQTSCNAYFCYGFRSMIDYKMSKYGTAANAFEVWKTHLVSMGYGYKLGVDLPGESRGFIPNAETYNKRYGAGHWSANTIISVSIGQGEILATPLQIANLCATVANRGWFVTPHVVKQVQDTVLDPLYTERRYTSVSSKYYDVIAEGMRMAVTGGTCRGAIFPGVDVAGKTGTAQNPHGKDHSAFMGFGPYEDPKIAVCCYVENAGFGATYGVPIGSLVMEKYLNGEIAPHRKELENRMMQTTLKYDK